MALSTWAKKSLGRGSILRDDAVGVLRSVLPDVRDGGIEIIDHAHGNDGIEIFRVPILLAGRLTRASTTARHLIAAHLAAGREQRTAADGARCVAAQARSTSSVSAEPQTPVRRIFAFSTMRFAIVKICVAMHIHVANALEMPDHRHPRFLLHARNQTLSAARHDDIDAVGHVGEHMAHRRAIRGRHQLNARWRQSRRDESLLQTGVDGGAGPCSFPNRRVESPRCRTSGTTRRHQR